MNKLLSTLYVLFACVTTMIAQVTITRSELVGTKWQLSEDSDSNSNEYYEFTIGNAIWHCNDGTTISYPFYLSTIIPTQFDSTKVGVSTKGCYYIEYADKDYFSCYAITYFDKSKGLMILKRKKPDDVIGLTDTYYFQLMKK